MKVLYSKKNGISNKLSGVNLPVDADKINYDNTESELQSTNVQDAIDEIVDGLDNKVDKVTGKGLSTNDYDNTDKAKVDKIDETTTSASGNPISISGLKSNQLAKDPIITLEPIQAGSGDPSPSNVRAISGYDKIEVLSCGKNLLPITASTQEINGITFTINTDKSITVSGTATSDARLQMCTAAEFGKHPKGTYVLTGCPAGGSLSTYYMVIDAQDTVVKDFVDIGEGSIRTYDSEMTVQIQNISLVVKQGFVANTPITFYPMLRDARISDPTYEPYHKTTDLSLQIGQTVYGGTLDVEKGILTVTHTLVTLSGLTFSASTETENYRKWAAYSEQSTYPAGDNLPLSNIAPKGTSTTAIYYANEKGVSWVSGYLNVVVDKSVTQETMNSLTLQLCYAIDNPYTIQLTPHEISLLKDYAYVSTNGTNMSFSYKNGEMASLGDVESLGKTMNLLGNSIIDNFNYTNLGDAFIDFNTLTIPGVYSQYVHSSSKDSLHAPMNGWIQLYVTRADNSQTYVQQLAIDVNMNEYTRSSQGGIWSVWTGVQRYSLSYPQVTTFSLFVNDGATEFKLKRPTGSNRFTCRFDVCTQNLVFVGSYVVAINAIGETITKISGQDAWINRSTTNSDNVIITIDVASVGAVWAYGLFTAPLDIIV